MSLQVASGLLKVEVTLLVSASSTESDTGEGGPRSALEEQYGENDAKSEAEGRFDDEVREAAIPLEARDGRLAPSIFGCSQSRPSLNPPLHRRLQRFCRTHLLVEECFAHRPGNGAGLGTGDSGVGHCWGCDASKWVR